MLQREGGDGDKAPLPTAPSSTKKKKPAKGEWLDDYRQTWTYDGISYAFSSGHGWRPNHHPSGEAPGPDIQQVAEMDVIELAILQDFVSGAGVPKEGAQGERSIKVNGSDVSYRYKRFNASTVGVGTYFMPG